ncbi:ATP-binding cassette domain-containing protein [Roseibium sp.]|uniref:ATP-binding cassette domain-containing protein n=1 Tax=Roseibium sp. TaxID=1936156 RepID=UPI003A979877
MSGLALKDFGISLNDQPLMTLNKHVEPGSVLTVMGPSGSGKSSLLNGIAGFSQPPFETSGQLILNERDITHLPPQDRRIGLMFQSPMLFPHLSVSDNLLFGLPKDEGSRAQRKLIAKHALERVGLETLGGRDPMTLSGGQQTRVALMRVLLSRPEVLLLDEPFSSLDRALRADIRDLVLTVAKDEELPVVLVTHDPEDAQAAGGEVLEL